MPAKRKRDLSITGADNETNGSNGAQAEVIKLPNVEKYPRKRISVAVSSISSPGPRLRSCCETLVLIYVTVQCNLCRYRKTVTTFPPLPAFPCNPNGRRICQARLTPYQEVRCRTTQLRLLFKSRRRVPISQCSSVWHRERSGDCPWRSPASGLRSDNDCSGTAQA